MRITCICREQIPDLYSPKSTGPSNQFLNELSRTTDAIYAQTPIPGPWMSLLVALLSYLGS